MSNVITKEIETKRVRWLDILILLTVLGSVFVLSIQIDQTLGQVSLSQEAVKTERLVVDAVVTSHAVIDTIELFKQHLRDEDIKRTRSLITSISVNLTQTSRINADRSAFKNGTMLDAQKTIAKLYKILSILHQDIDRESAVTQTLDLAKQLNIQLHKIYQTVVRSFNRRFYGAVVNLSGKFLALQTTIGLFCLLTLSIVILSLLSHKVGKSKA